VTEKTLVLPVKIIDEPSELTEPADIESDPAESETPIAIIRTLIAFMTTALFDLFPLQKAKIHAILEETSNPFSNIHQSLTRRPKHTLYIQPVK
jgi:hypothetical protein